MKEYPIKNILVPTDFSRIARNALSHAERIANPTRACITLMNVTEPVRDAFATSGMLSVSSRLEEKQEVFSANRLRRIAGAAEKRSGVRVNTLTAIGRIAPSITRAAAKTRADLIIMGTHGATGFVENLLGSNTYRIASLAKTPLLSVHKKIGRSGFKHIIYPIRDQRQAMIKFPHALMFARLFRADVHIVGLLQPAQQGHETHMRGTCGAIEEMFTENKIHVRTVFTPHSSFPDFVIRYAHSRQGSLVAIVQDSDFHLVELFQGTFTKKILHKILSPVLTVPHRR